MGETMKNLGFNTEMKLFEKNRKALKKIYDLKKVKNKFWLDLHNCIVDLNQDYIFYEEKNGDDTLITQGVVSSYIAKEMGGLK